MSAPRHWVAAALALGLGAGAWAWPSLRGLLAPLLLGWLLFAQASLAEAGLAWIRLAEFGLSLLLVGAGLQWLLGGMTSGAWSPRRTVTLVAGLLMVFVIGMASHGLVRQLVWLAQGPLIRWQGGL